MATDPREVIASETALDAAFPKRRPVRRRLARHRARLERDPEYVRGRLLALLDEEGEEAEFARLAAVYKTLKKKEADRGQQ